MQAQLFIFCFLFVTFIKCDAQDFEWAKKIHSKPGEVSWGSKIIGDKFGNTYTIGIFSDTVDLDPGNSTFNIASPGTRGIYIVKLDSMGNFIWGFSVNNDNYPDGICDMALDNSGNVYACGYFRDSVDFDPGPGIYNLIDSGIKALFVLKLNSSGSIQWVKYARSINNNSSSQGNSICIDSSGSVYVTGDYSNTVDFDPGSNVYLLQSSPGAVKNMYLLKLDSLGNFIWAKGVGNTCSSCSNSGSDICVDISGNIYAMGSFKGLVDFDPGISTYNLSSFSPTDNDMFISKLDSGGGFIWAKKISGLGGESPQSITIDNNQNILTTGYFSSNPADFDPSVDTFYLFAPNNQNAFVLKLDSSGNFLWAKNYGGTERVYSTSIGIDQLDNIYTTGFFEGTADFDPGPGIFDLHSHGTVAMYIEKSDSAGHFIWAKSIGDYSFVEGFSLFIDADKNIYSTGLFSDTTDFDPDSNSVYYFTESGYNTYILKWSQDICSNFSLVVDSAANIGCTHSGFTSAYASNGISPYSYSWNTVPPTVDSLSTFNVPGIYTLTVNDDIGCVRSSSVLITSNGVMGGIDLSANIIHFPTLRPAQTLTLVLDTYNDGCIPVAGNLIFIHDSLLSYNSAVPVPDAINGDTLMWYFNSLTFDSAHFRPHVTLTTDSVIPLNYHTCFTVIANPISGDLDSTNNSKHYCVPVQNSFDPNGKTVFPEGTCDEKYVLSSQKLTYTIGFQNTGNALAINIVLLDFLNSHLNLNTVRVVGKSHPNLITEILPGNVLKFQFYNIFLPDSATNEMASHGYVIYEVQPVTSLPTGTQVNNQASIYFDYNSPIMTNNVNTTLVNVIPSSINTTITQIGITLMSNEIGATYQWVNCSNGNMQISGATNQYFTAPFNGNFAVVITKNSCTEMSGCINITTVGIINFESQNDLRIFPNPSSGIFTAESPDKTSQEFIVMDAKGAILINGNSALEGSHIDLSAYDNGIYYLKYGLNYYKLIKLH